MRLKSCVKAKIHRILNLLDIYIYVRYGITAKRNIWYCSCGCPISIASRIYVG